MTNMPICRTKVGILCKKKKKKKETENRVVRKQKSAYLRAWIISGSESG